MEFVIAISMLALVEYVVFGALVGRSRAKYGVKAPATTGHEIFERYFRVHQNTLEQLVAAIRRSEHCLGDRPCRKTRRCRSSH